MACINVLLYYHNRHLSVYNSYFTEARRLELSNLSSVHFHEDVSKHFVYSS